jgi:protein-disulfide isomerase-like protein with CxxC motif
MSAEYFGGVPTKIDVDKLRKEIGVPEEGQLITYQRIAEVTGNKFGTHRYATVLNAWRRALRSEHEIEMGADAGKGLFRLKPGERVQHGSAKFRSGMRHIVRAARVVTMTDRSRLNPEEIRTADHLTLRAANIKAAIAAAPKTKEPGLGLLEKK